MSTFGNGSPGNTWWNFNGSNFCWTHWVGGSYGSGSVGRVTAIAAYWASHSGTTTGHNDIWDAGSLNRVQLTGNYNVGVSGHGVWNNVGCGDVWQDHASYYIGFWRTNTQSDDEYVGGGGSYSGKSADDANIGSGSNCGTSGSNNQNIAAYATVTDTLVYVRRSGAWVQKFPYVRRGTGWNLSYTYVRRSGGWTLVNEYLQKGERQLPRQGLPVLVCSAGPWGGPECPFCEPGWLAEDGRKSWFGSLDVSKLGIPWDQEGHYERDSGKLAVAFASPRRSSNQPEQEVEWLAEELERKNRLLKEGHDPKAVLAAWANTVPAATIEGLPRGKKWSALRPSFSLSPVLRAPSPT